MMNKFLKVSHLFRSCVLASLGVAILAVTVSLTTSGRALAQRVKEDCITICNTASNPLHVIVQGITRVTGDVKINNEDPIATTVTGPVHVTTSRGEALSVVPRMRLEDRFQKSASLELADGQHEVSTTFAVPAGKLLVIVSAVGVAQTNTIIESCGEFCASFDVECQHPSVLVETHTDNSAFNHALATVLSSAPHTDAATQFINFWNVGGMMQLYADPGTEIEVIFRRPNTEKGKKGPVSLSLTLSGHYVDAN